MAAVNILNHIAPGAAVETALYTATKDNKAVLFQLVVCNRSASPNKFRVSISLLGAATQLQDYLLYDMPINGNDTYTAEMGITLNAFDAIRVYDTNGTLSFTLFGNPT